MKTREVHYILWDTCDVRKLKKARRRNRCLYRENKQLRQIIYFLLVTTSILFLHILVLTILR